MVIHDVGMIALVLDQPYDTDTILGFMQLSGGIRLPAYTMVLSAALPEPRWIHTESQGEVAVVDRGILIAAVCDCDQAVARLVVEGIQRYYGRQVLEPSIRGFLSILEKQFPRNDLYLFELLQNAVDDAASEVVFKSFPQGILFMHNGRGFSPMDVLGLASVGLSTKAVEGASKRNVGFMGIGFKAVYKVNSKLLIDVL
jgi:hypothetical protein